MLKSFSFGFFFLAICLGQLSAQDRIHRKGGEVINAKVTEVGLEEIKYKLKDDPDGPVYSIAKDRLVKVVYQNGRVESYQNSLTDKELYIGQPRNAIKLNFLSPFFGYTGMSFEHSIKPGQSIEVNLAIIGLGISQKFEHGYVNGGMYLNTYNRNPGGVGLGVGYKFIRTPDFINHNIRYAHLLQGGYIKPLIYLGTYGENVLDDKTGTAVLSRRNVTYGSLMVDLGKQWGFGQKFLLDIYAGVGYAVDNVKDDPFISSSFSTSSSAHNFSFIRAGNNPGLALSAGLRFGMLLGGKKGD